MYRCRVVVLVTALLTTGVATSGQRAAIERPDPLASFAEPAISPDRAEIAVVSSGDIWTVSSNGGEARLLVSNEANEQRLFTRRMDARSRSYPTGQAAATFTS